MLNQKFILAAGFNYPGASVEKADNWIRPALQFCQAGVLKGKRHNRHKFCRLTMIIFIFIIFKVPKFPLDEMYFF